MITSGSNPRYKEAIAIKKGHAEFRNEAFFIEGRRIVGDALASNAKIERIFYTERVSDEFEILRAARERRIETIQISDRLMERLSDTESPQGIAAIASIPARRLDGIKIRGDSIILVSDGLKDPGNMGGSIRSSAAFGVDCVVVLPGTVNPFSPKVIRAAAGAIFHVPVVFAGLDEFFRWSLKNRLRLISTRPDIGKEPHETDLKSGFSLVIGEEAWGVGAEFKDRRCIYMRIRTANKVESLNVSVTTAICLYEAQRQRGRWRER